MRIFVYDFFTDLSKTSIDKVDKLFANFDLKIVVDGLACLFNIEKYVLGCEGFSFKYHKLFFEDVVKTD